MSALFLCEAVAATGRADARHTAIDPAESEAWDDAGLLTIERAGLSSILEFHERASQVVLAEFAGKRTFDLAFIDGDHRFEGAFTDLYYAGRLVKPGGVIVVDDMWMPAVRLAASYFVTNLGWKIIAVDLPCGCYVGHPSTWWEADQPFRRMVVLRRPPLTVERGWDHFVPFGPGASLWPEDTLIAPEAQLEAISELLEPDEAFILVDQDEWATGQLVAGHRRIPFLEHNGHYGGVPADDEEALTELERLRREGARLIVFAPPAFWWLEHYSGLHRHLRSEFSCVLENDRLVVFDLRSDAPPGPL